MTSNTLPLARVLIVVAAILPAMCDAQEIYPARPVRLVVPNPPGGGVDLLARLAAQKLAEVWGKPVVVENRVGATGTIAVAQVATATPDGYTLLFANDLPIVVVPTLFKTPYDPRKDLTPIAAVAQGMSLLLVHPSTGVSSLTELIAAAKAKPGALRFSSGGDGSAAHMCVELLKQETRINLLHVPYKGAAPAMQAALTGEVSMYCAPMVQGLPHVKSGKMKALAVTGAKPSLIFPELAPLSAQGLQNVTVLYWYAVFAPIGTPPVTLKTIRDSLKKVFDEADMRQKLAGAGIEPLWMEADELAAVIRSDLDRWTRVVKTMGIRTE